MFGIYIHIAYCRTICPYCDFVRERTPGPVPDGYVDALCREIEAFEGPDAAGSVFFGGGTPSLLKPEGLSRILECIGRRFRLDDAEISLEANPDDVTPELATFWREAGVNRVSLGVQSFDDRVLRYLGRRHDAEAALRACETVANAFNNWNLDLIFGARPLEAWPATLARCLSLAPPHVAAYGLTYEPGTPFDRRRGDAVSDDDSLRMYQELEIALAGYDHYEISNFARPGGYEARHNLVYWRNEEYAGFGTAAFSFVSGVRARNQADTRKYLKAPGGKEESLRLSDREMRVETLIQHFRLRKGLEIAHYESRFGQSLHSDFGAALDQLMARGLLEQENAIIRPTQQGFYLNNEIGLMLV